MIEHPEQLSRWTHYNGNHYTVLMIANIHSTDLHRYPITVVYQGTNDRVWTRPLNDWYRSFTKHKP